LGNRQDGLGWTEYPSNYSSLVHTSFTDGFAIVAISPYYVQNNTGGLVDDEYGEYTLDYTVAVEDGIPWVFNDTAAIDMQNASHNFTLGDPGESPEVYLLPFDCEVGKWMNVSVSVEDVTSWSCVIYQEIEGKTQYLSWAYLDDTFSGSYTTNGTFQFGSISDSIMLYFKVNRALVGEGRLDIALDPHVTNSFNRMSPVLFQSTEPVVPPGPDMGLVAAGIGITVVAVVVVLVVILKKKPQLLGR
ncbi:MAG: hypothetical protein ACTSUB_09155, partial [Candidatus Thorarchaeota archaeon]